MFQTRTQRTEVEVAENIGALQRVIFETSAIHWAAERRALGLHVIAQNIASTIEVVHRESVLATNLIEQHEHEVASLRCDGVARDAVAGDVDDARNVSPPSMHLQTPKEGY
jgi:hypothetical protein